MAAKRLSAATFSRRHMYNHYLFVGGTSRTFLVRTCFPSVDKMYVRVLRQDPCAYCGKRDSTARQLSEIVLLERKKGPRDLGNVTAACQSCNLARRQATLLHFMLDQVNRGDGVSEAPRGLLLQAAELAENRGSRPAIARLIHRALKEFDSHSEVS